MGLFSTLFGGSSTSSVKLPKASANEEALDQLTINTLLPAYLGTLGYDVSTKTSSLEDDPKYQKFQTQIDAIDTQLAELPNDRANADRISQLRGQRQQLELASSRYADKFQPEISFETREKMTPKLEALRDKYGENSSQYKSAYEDYQSTQVKQATQQEEVYQKFLDIGQKFMSGDFSLSADQKTYVKNLFAPIQKATKSMFDGILSEVKNTDKSMSDAISEYETRIKETGMNVSEALTSLGEQIQATGKSMDEALTNTISVHKELVKMGIEDYTGEITKNTANRVAMTGRSPNDPEYQNEIQQNVAREVERSQLQLAGMEAEGRMGIAQRTGAGLEDVEMRRAALAERTGSGLEQGALMRGQLAERTGSMREQVASQRGQANVGLAQQQADLEYNMGAVMPSTLLGVGVDVGQYSNLLRQQEAQNAGQALSGTQGVTSGYRQLRMAQPSQTTSQSPGIFNTIADLGSGIASAYTGIQTSNYLRSLIG